MKKILLILLLVLSGCYKDVDLLFTYQVGATTYDAKVTNKEKQEIIDYLSSYEFKYDKRDEYYYGGAYYVVEYEIDSIEHHWIISGSASECTIKKYDNEIHYLTYDLDVILELSKYIYENGELRK